MENKKVLKLIHDLNNILCACNGFTEMLLESENSEDKKKMLSISHKGLLRMRDILDEVYLDLIKETKKD